jgi:glycosyltransferase involved in cell wall biosynthesis
MRILHIFNEINFSGAEIMYADAAPLFQQKGFSMIAVNTGLKKGNFTEEFEKANIKILYRPISTGYKNPLFLLRYFRNMYRYIKQEKIDVVHVHRSDIFWYYAVCARLAGKKTIVTPHNIFKNRKITWIKAYLERLSARKLFRTTFQTIGESVYNNELHYYKNPSVRINNWYNAGRFFPARVAEKAAMREKLGIPDKDFVIVSTGSCSVVKNHGDIIKAMPIVLQQFPCTYLHLGTGHLEEQEKKQADHYNIAGSVRFPGNKKNVRDYLVAADVYIMPSKFEGLSIAAIEAMACGLPGILYNSPGLTDLIKDDNNGFLINPEPAVIAEKIIAFRNQPTMIDEKGANAMRFVTKHFNMAESVSQISALYKK